MSVWKHPHYRDSPLQWALRNIAPSGRKSPFFKSLCNFTVEDFGDFPVPPNLERGNLRALLDLYEREDREAKARNELEEFKGERLLEAINTNTQVLWSHQDALTKTVQTYDEAVSGIRCVYELAAHVIRSARSQSFVTKRTDDAPFIDKLVDYGLAASAHSPGDAPRCKHGMETAVKGSLERGREFVQDLLRFRGYFRARSYKNEVLAATYGSKDAPYPEIPSDKLGHWVHWSVSSTPGAILLRPPFGLRTYVLLSGDVERLERITRGGLLAYTYFDTYGILSEYDRFKLDRAIDKMLDLMCEVFCSIPKDRENEVARAFDVAYYRYLADYVVKDDDRAKREQEEKYREEKLEAILPFSKFRAVVTGLKPKEAMEVLLMYKCMPQADYDYFGAAKRQQDMYVENQAAANEDEAAMGLMFEEIIAYHKWVMLVAFNARHGRCPGIVKDTALDKKWHRTYPHVKPMDIPPTEVNDIDFNGDFMYVTRSKDCLQLVKDKAILPKNINDIKDIKDVRETPVAKKNYLMDVMTRDNPIDLTDLYDDLANDRMQLDVRADDKAEAKRLWQRWFMELDTDPRLVLSNYEESITEYAHHVPGCFTGKSEQDKTNIMNWITAPGVDVLPYHPLLVSFDIKKFSPYIPDRVHRRLDEHWAEAFGMPVLKHMHKIFTEGKMHYVKGCIHHEFDKTGADFEGFCGKKLTVYHCAVMGYVMRRLRRAQLVDSPGRFAALIDDGLLRVNLKAEDYKVRKFRVLREIERVYKKAALRISWDKTFCSKSFGTFLHEVRVNGRSLTAGFRAALKITNLADVPASSLVDDLMNAAGTTAGAIKSGAPMISAYMIYLYMAYDATRRWDRGKGRMRNSEAIRCFFPQQLGGLGYESLHGLVGSIGSNCYSEYIGNLKRIGLRFPEIRAAVNEKLNCAVKHTSEIARRIDPTRIVTQGKRIRNDRLVRALEKAVLTRVNSPVLAVLLSSGSSSGAGFLGAALAAGSRIPIPLRKLMNDSEKTEVIGKVAKKFLTARSALCVIKYRQLHRIQIANRKEAEQFLQLFH